MKFEGEDRIKWKVIRRDTYAEIVAGAPVVESNDEAGTCVLLVPVIDDKGYVVLNDDGTPKLTEARYDLSNTCGICTLKRR